MILFRERNFFQIDFNFNFISNISVSFRRYGRSLHARIEETGTLLSNYLLSFYLTTSTYLLKIPFTLWHSNETHRFILVRNEEHKLL